MRSIALQIGTVCVLCCGSALASEPASLIVDATELDGQLSGARDTCEAIERAADVDSIAVANPAMFYGQDARSSQWPQVREAYLRYAVSTCVPKDVPAYVELAASIYQQHLTREEMDAVLKFYNSAAGKKFVVASSRLSEALNKKMHEESRQVLEAAGEMFDSDMRRLSGEKEVK